MIRDMGLIQFRSYIFADRSLKPKILQGACDLIAADRGAETSIVADSTLLRNAIELHLNCHFSLRSVLKFILIAIFALEFLSNFYYYCAIVVLYLLSTI